MSIILLISFLTLFRNVRAEKFKSSIQVNFVLGPSNQTANCVWQDITSRVPGQRKRDETPNKAPADGPVPAGSVNFFSLSDKRAFKWIVWERNTETSGPSQTCEVWLEGQPDVKVLTYVLGSGSSDQPKENNQLRVRCYEPLEYTPPSVSASSRDAKLTPPSNPAVADTIQPLIVAFYGNPDNLFNPAWWLDGTDYTSPMFGFNNKMSARPANHADGSIGLGSMEFTYTSKHNRVYGWQSKSMNENINITTCDFGIAADLVVSNISFWVDSPRIEASNHGQAVEGWKSERFKESIINNCHKV